MTTPALWMRGGQLIAVNDHPVFCPDGPPACAACCPGSSTSRMYVWGHFMAAGSPLPPTVPPLIGFSCVVEAAHAAGAYNAFGFGANLLFSVNWNSLVPGGPIVADLLTPFTSCVQARLTMSCGAGCDGGGFVWQIGIGSASEVAGLATGTFTAELGGDACETQPSGCYFGSAGSNSPSGDPYMRFFLTDRDPATGILCPDSSIIPTELGFSITPSGFDPFTCSLLFAPNTELRDCFHLFLTNRLYCYAWFGFFNDCNGNQTRVAVYWDGSSWNLIFGEPTNTAQIVYTGVPFPTSGTASCCGDGSAPWTLTIPMMAMATDLSDADAAPAVRSVARPPAICPVCGSATTLVDCATCQTPDGRTQTRIKTCPKCGPKTAR